MLFRILFLLCFASSLIGYPFTDNGDGSILDNGTGLIWQKCSRGQNTDATCSGTATVTSWSLALIHCKNLSIGSKTWRLPNIKELRSLVNPAIYSSSLPYIDSNSFPSTMAGMYWSSTTSRSNVSAWYMSFSNGNNDIQNKAYDAYVRCVSGP